MARSVNQVFLLGRLTRDPEQRTTSNGRTIASFSIAVDRGGQDDTADFINITAWEKLADLVMQYLSKGRRVLVQGRLRQDSWEDKETGKRQSRIEVTATDVTFLDGPNSSSGASGGYGSGAGAGSSSSSSSSASANSQGKSAGSNKNPDVVIEDLDDKIDLSDIPF